eukprot:11224725-Lingulodinium_polyedra.AAC.1
MSLLRAAQCVRSRARTPEQRPRHRALRARTEPTYLRQKHQQTRENKEGLRRNEIKPRRCI